MSVKTYGLVTGNTYPVRAQLLALGGYWNPEDKGWEVPIKLLEEAQAIVAGAGPKGQRTAGQGGGGRKRRWGG